MLSTDVKLPKSRVPVWPARCVRCGDPPTTKFRVSTHAIGWWTALFAFGAKFTADAPACEPCLARMRTQRRLRFVVGLGFLAGGVLIGARWLGGTSGIRYWLVGLIALGVAAPWILWEVLAPKPIELTAFSDSVDYEFADPEYAAEFAALNDGELES